MSDDIVVVSAVSESSNATGVNGDQSNDNAVRSGAAYVFVNAGTNWIQEAFLKASNTEAGDAFGDSVAVFGNRVVVGAPFESSKATGVNGDQSNNNAVRSGAAYVFVRNGTNWTQEAYLKASNPGAGVFGGGGDLFGRPVAVSGGTVAVGAPWEDSSATGVDGDQCDDGSPDSGAVYVFDPNGSIPVPEIVVEQIAGIGLIDGSATVDFGRRRLECGSGRIFTIKNTGKGDLTGLNLTITGSDAADFLVTAYPATSLTQCDGTTTFTVAFSPGAPGAKTAYLHITSNDSDESPFDITLTASDRVLLPLPTVTQKATLASAGGHTLGLKIDGTLWSWGANGSGQLGDSTTEHRESPVQIGGCDWNAVVAADSRSFALKADHSLWAWGDNSYGQLGIGTSEFGSMTSTPTRVGTDNDWAAVAASGYRSWNCNGCGHTVALKLDGSLWAWGENRYGELGNSTDESRDFPMRIGTDTNWMAVAAGLFRTLALKSDGRLWAWGHLSWEQRVTSPIQIGTDNDWAAVASGEIYSLLLKSDGSIWEWTHWSLSRDPECLGAGNDWIAVDTTSVSSGGDFGNPSLDLALKRDGTLWRRTGATTFVLVDDGIQSAVTGALPSVRGFGGSYFALKLNGEIWLTEFYVPFETRRINEDTDWGAPLWLQSSNEFRIVRHSLGSDSRFRAVVGPVSNDCYSILYRGPSVTNIHQPVAVRLNFNSFNSCVNSIQLTDLSPASSNATAFYRVRQVPTAQPLDSDSDGIDDVYELRHSNFLNPLDASDAEQDFDGDGRSNLQEYQEGTDPEVP